MGNGSKGLKMALKKETPLSPEQVRAIIRLKAYEYYLERIDGEKTVQAFEGWFAEQKISQALK